MSLNPLDYVFIGILLFFLVTGYIKGFLAQFLQILAIVASFFLASRFYLALAENDLFEGMRQSSASAAQVTAWVCLFFVCGAIFSVLSSIIVKRLQNEHVKAGDRWLGALFSSAKGVVLLGGIALADSRSGSFQTDSRCHRPISRPPRVWSPPATWCRVWAKLASPSSTSFPRSSVKSCAG